MMKDYLDGLLYQEFLRAMNDKNSDIHAHLGILRSFARACSSVTEFGVRDGQSTRAFLSVPGLKIRSYDLYLDPTVQKLFDESNDDVDYIIGDSLKIEIEQTDLLFIDTDHTPDQLYAELDRHHQKVNKYIIMHDTDIPYGLELLSAIMEFLSWNNQHWEVFYHTRTCHGLTVLKKK